jgi:hypothetical protein
VTDLAVVDPSLTTYTIQDAARCDSFEIRRVGEIKRQTTALSGFDSTLSFILPDVPGTSS